MEKMRSKDGKVVSYREKVYVDGKAITKTFKRKSDALSWKRSFLLELQRRQALGIDHIESIDFKSFFKYWIQMKKNQNMARRTVESYGSVIRKYLVPCVGKTKLERINMGHAEKVVRLGVKNGISPKRINFNLAVFKQILGDAVRLNHLIRNPLVGFKKVKERPRSLVYWMPEQVNKFLSSSRNDPNYPIYLMALNTGLRRGEILWSSPRKVDTFLRAFFDYVKYLHSCQQKKFIPSRDVDGPAFASCFGPFGVNRAISTAYAAVFILN